MLPHFLTISLIKSSASRGSYQRASGVEVENFEISDGQIDATVQGTTDIYDVTVTWDEDSEDIDAVCSCPDSRGGWCKHAVAVLLRALDSSSSSTRSSSKRKSSPKASATPTPNVFSTPSPSLFGSGAVSFGMPTAAAQQFGGFTQEQQFVARKQYAEISSTDSVTRELSQALNRSMSQSDATGVAQVLLHHLEKVKDAEPTSALSALQSMTDWCTRNLSSLNAIDRYATFLMAANELGDMWLHLIVNDSPAMGGDMRLSHRLTNLQANLRVWSKSLDHYHMAGSLPVAVSTIELMSGASR